MKRSWPAVLDRTLVWSDSGTVVDSSVRREYFTIDSIFGTLQLWLDARPDSVNAQYDSQRGYPTHFFANNSDVVDGYHWLTVSKFKLAGFFSAPQRKRDPLDCASPFFVRPR